MKFLWTTLPVKNMDESLGFYNSILGLPIASRKEDLGMKMIMLGEEGQPKLELIWLASNQGKPLQSDITIGISVESMDNALQMLQRYGIRILRGPISPAPNITFLFVNDPNGYQVQLVEMGSKTEALESDESTETL